MASACGPPAALSAAYARLPKGHTPYDLALLIHVLEHAEDPADLLKTIWRLLERNGILFIEVPNRNRFALRRSLRNGTLPEGEYPPHHLTFWSIEALAEALTRTGYRVIECGARPLGAEGQVEMFLESRLGVPPSRGTRWMARILIVFSRLFRLQGETIYAVARRMDDVDVASR